MSSTLAKHSASWFVARPVRDDIPAVDCALAVADRHAFALSLVKAVDTAKIKAQPDFVRIDPARLCASAAGWNTLFDVRDSLLACAFRVGVEEHDPRQHERAFADFIVTRWIWRQVFSQNIAKRPLNQAFPPPFDGQALTGLAERLVEIVTRLGVDLKDAGALVASASRWKTLSDARDALLRQACG
jgi:hypothetical protein